MNIRIFLGNNCINTERCFTNLTITDDEFTLTASNRSHCIHRFGAGVTRFMNTLSCNNTRGEYFDFGGEFRINCALAINGLSEAVNNTSFHCRTNGHLCNLSSTLDNVTFLDSGNITQYRTADVISLQVQGKTHNVARELQKFHGHTILYAIDPGNTVTDGYNGAGLVEVNTGFVLPNLIFDYLTYFFGLDLHLFSPLNGIF